MRSTGIVRQLDQLGRVVLPKELRDYYSINIKDPLEVLVEGDKIILRKYNPCCIFCGNGNNTKTYKNKIVCSDCVSELKEEAI